MKCPGCGGEVPHVALKCKHCGVALKKQAAAAPPVKEPPAPRPEDPLKALAREAVEAQKAKQKTPTGKLPPPPPRKAPTGKLPPLPPGTLRVEGAATDGAYTPPPPPDPKRQILINLAVGLAVLGAGAAFSQSAYAQRQITNWSASTAVRKVPFEVHEGEYLGAGSAQFRAPTDPGDVPDLPAGTRGLAYDLKLDLAFRGPREATFTMVGKLGPFSENAQAIKTTAAESREFQATYGRNVFRSVRYKLADAEGRRRIHRYYVSKKNSDTPFSIEFAYDETPGNVLLIDRLIDRILTSVVE